MGSPIVMQTQLISTSIMRFFVLLALFGASFAAPSSKTLVQGGYGGGRGFSAGGNYGGVQQVVSTGGYSGGNYGGVQQVVSTGGYSGGGAVNVGYNVGAGCGSGQIQNVDGTCFDADTTKNVYVFESPKKQIIYGPPPIIPKGRIHENVLYLKTPEIVGNNDPIIIPPSQTKTTLYVLSQNGQQGQRVVQYAEGQRTSPEVFYVHYNDGENPTLPNGLDLNTALSNAAAGLGQFVGGGLSGGVSVGAGGGYGVAGGAAGGYGVTGGASGGYGVTSGAGAGYGVTGGAGAGYGPHGVSAGYDGGDQLVVTGAVGGGVKSGFVSSSDSY